MNTIGSKYAHNAYTYICKSPFLFITMLFQLFFLFFFHISLLVLSLSSSLPHLSFSPSTFLLLLSCSGPVCWPCSVYSFLSLLWTLPDTSGYSLPHIYNKKPCYTIPWGSQFNSLYSYVKQTQSSARSEYAFNRGTIHPAPILSPQKFLSRWAEQNQRHNVVEQILYNFTVVI